MTTSQKAVRFEIEYDDGTVLRLSGEDAERHLRWVNTLCSLGAMHGFSGGHPEVRWQREQRAPGREA